jgi:hypothetical protein
MTGPVTKSRRDDVQEMQLDPQSLVGSWFHRIENDAMYWQGVVVAEPKSGHYLLHVTSAANMPDNVQRIVPIERMLGDDDGYEWRFYDTQQEAIDAYSKWLTKELMG